MSGIVRSAVRLTAWTAGLLAAGRVLYGAGSDNLRIPLTSLTDFGTWLADTPPPTMAMAVATLGGATKATAMATAPAPTANHILRCFGAARS